MFNLPPHLNAPEALRMPFSTSPEQPDPLILASSPPRLCTSLYHSIYFWTLLQTWWSLGNFGNRQISESRQKTDCCSDLLHGSVQKTRS